MNKGLERLGFVNRTDYTLEDYGDGKGIVFTWLSSKPQPTNAEIKTASDQWEADKYQRDRKAEYDQLNQYEMMFDDKRDGTTTWVDKINEIKSRHPQ